MNKIQLLLFITVIGFLAITGSAVTIAFVLRRRKEWRRRQPQQVIPPSGESGDEAAAQLSFGKRHRNLIIISLLLVFVISGIIITDNQRLHCTEPVQATVEKVKERKRSHGSSGLSASWVYDTVVSYRAAGKEYSNKLICLKKLPVGSAIDIFYDPNRPGSAALEREIDDAAWRKDTWQGKLFTLFILTAVSAGLLLAVNMSDRDRIRKQNNKMHPE